VSSESQNLLSGGFQNRSFERNSAIILITVRPFEVKSQDWAKQFEEDLSANKIFLKVKYKYFSLPVFGAIFSGENSLYIGKRVLIDTFIPK
jgi:hypothetical protein